MIKEIVNFMRLLPDDFKTMGSQPKEGLHILLHQKVDRDQICSIDLVNFEYEMYSKKDEEVSPFLEECKIRHQNAWCIDTNKCFDLPIKAIHSCSPFMVAFKREHLKGGTKYLANAGGKKKQIYERFVDYFEKAFALFDNDNEKHKYEVYRNFFTQEQFVTIIERIERNFDIERSNLLTKKEEINELLKKTIDKVEKENIKLELKKLDQSLLKLRDLSDGEYLIFYLDLPVDQYKSVHKKYLDDKLFNTDKYNTPPDESGIIYGTSNFMNGFNSNMPFLMHQSASFDITGRITNEEAKLLHEFKGVLPNKVLPNPLPLFVYKDELNGDMVRILRENGFKLGYQEIIQKMVNEKNSDLSNYYLLYWQNTKDGLVFKDYDFISNFEYKFGTIDSNKLCVENLFEAYDDKKLKGNVVITDVFHLENVVFKPLIGNKYHKVDCFSDLNTDGYEILPNTFVSYSKYRKVVYDYVYKSQRQVIDYNVFYEMVFNSIKDSIKNGYINSVKEKLNIWYSVQHHFNQQNKEYMGSKLKEYQSFVNELISEEGLQMKANDEHFAFTAGMVISYILNKSKSADNSYLLLEPYLQQAKCSEFKKAIANDFARYKHENFSRSFERAAAFVLSYETEVNLKKLMPEILSGVFAKNQLYSSK
ncbi:hypothetical protein HX045_15225 [Myroides odoratimimus]|uniref:Uncharacterized protein n=2 Tax=Myroides odoratimimus TaxID=76832 RepID=A0A0S7EBM9_9FLAO|nr:hypothetical protein [Myroides odoratimimus]ALU27791.1 hypothetical protein AS202_17285 [Myroides odoratimimus]EHO09812.1 hypothetical protein HMPREF9712_01589 [Myroides odoratimimus CCUG 10230]MCA4806502.1 hypothetical protein [Myroides odoratimimus]MDM1059701.1 hypothetical protein [Myroides odoratimimus]MDM1085650.1 hypothetical protein [Myroides odoratimimus]